MFPVLATQPMTGYEARALLTECCSLIGRYPNRSSGSLPPSPEQCVFRAELMVRDAYEMVGEDFGRPTMLNVFEAAEVLAEQNHVSHPGFSAQLQQLVTYCARRAM